MFSTQSENGIPPFVNNFDIISLFVTESEETKIGISGKGLTNDKFLDWSKLKPFADDKRNPTNNTCSFLRWVGNIVGKGENAGYQHFLLFSQCF